MCFDELILTGDHKMQRTTRWQYERAICARPLQYIRTYNGIQTAMSAMPLPTHHCYITASRRISIARVIVLERSSAV